jgi:glycogen debranching enzyme
MLTVRHDVEPVMMATITVDGGDFVADKKEINGLKYNVRNEKEIADMVDVVRGQDQQGQFARLAPRQFPKGAIALFETKLFGTAQASIAALDGFSKTAESTLSHALGDCTLVDLNVLLYRSEPEERDAIGEGLYSVPNYGNFVYAGLQGVESCIEHIHPCNLGHPFCDHLRQGTWLLDYTITRLSK